MEEGIQCDIYGRMKTPYSIWNKIKSKDISFEQLSDIMAFRIITNSTRECYKLLGITHRKFSYIQGRFKDFISSPKNNGYRAVHTSVIGPKNKKIEIQFKSNVMNQIAEFGVAAHWKYKDPKKVKENVINIDGQDFTEKSLSQSSKYLIAQIKDLEAQQSNLQFQMDQKLAALSVMRAKLAESLKPEEEVQELAS